MHKPLTVTRSALLENDTDRSFRKFLHDFMVFSRCLEKVRDCLAKKIGVTAPQYEILSHLRQNASAPGLSVSAIAMCLHCSGSFATTEVAKLEAIGLVRKVRDQCDARRLQVTLTASCEARFRSIAPVQQQLNDALFASVGAKEFKVLHKVFSELTRDGDRAIGLAEAFELTSGLKQLAS